MISCCPWCVFKGFGIPVVVDAAGTASDVDCSTGYLYVCLPVDSFGICCCDLADADIGIVGFGGLKPPLTANHVPFKRSPSPWIM